MGVFQNEQYGTMTAQAEYLADQSLDGTVTGLLRPGGAAGEDPNRRVLIVLPHVHDTSFGDFPSPTFLEAKARMSAREISRRSRSPK